MPVRSLGEPQIGVRQAALVGRCASQMLVEGEFRSISVARKEGADCSVTEKQVEPSFCFASASIRRSRPTDTCAPISRGAGWRRLATGTVRGLSNIAQPADAIHSGRRCRQRGKSPFWCPFGNRCAGVFWTSDWLIIADELRAPSPKSKKFEKDFGTCLFNVAHLSVGHAPSSTRYPFDRPLFQAFLGSEPY